MNDEKQPYHILANVNVCRNFTKRDDLSYTEFALLANNFYMEWLQVELTGKWKVIVTSEDEQVWIEVKYAVNVMIHTEREIPYYKDVKTLLSTFGLQSPKRVVSGWHTEYDYAADIHEVVDFVHEDNIRIKPNNRKQRGEYINDCQQEK